MTDEERPETRGDVLIVEDTMVNLRVVSEILAANGYRVHPVASGGKALQVAKTTALDLILLDINLPDMRGDTAMKMVRRAAATSRQRPLPVIVISGLPLEELMEIQGQVGAVGCIQKPAPLETIVERVQQVLAMRRRTS